MRNSSDNPFECAPEFPGASGAIRRALTHAYLNTPRVKRVINACVALKYKAVSPAYRKQDDINWAHIGIPSKKIVIYISSTGGDARIRIDNKRKEWKKVGWNMLSVTFAGVDSLTDDALTKHLGDAIKSVSR